MSFDYDFFLLLLPSAVEDRTEIWGKNWGLSGVSLGYSEHGLDFHSVSRHVGWSLDNLDHISSVTNMVQ